MAQKSFTRTCATSTAGKNLWLTETGKRHARRRVCRAVVDVFRYLNQLGTLAQKNVQVVMHNTLAASDYGLLNEETLQPRPDFWAGLLWKRTMGDVVLDPGTPKDEGLRIYAHCSKKGRRRDAGGAEHGRGARPGAFDSLELCKAGADRADLASSKSLLNGKELEAGTDEPSNCRMPKTRRKVCSASCPRARIPDDCDAHNKSCN